MIGFIPWNHWIKKINSNSVWYRDNLLSASMEGLVCFLAVVILTVWPRPRHLIVRMCFAFCLSGSMSPVSGCRVSGTRCVLCTPISPLTLSSRKLEVWWRSETFWERSTFAESAWGMVSLQVMLEISELQVESKWRAQQNWRSELWALRSKFEMWHLRWWI